MSTSVLTCALLLAVESAPPIVALAVTPDGSQLLAGSQSGVRILSLPKLEPAGTIATKLEQVHELAFSPQGNALAIAGGSPGERGAVELWEWPAAKLLATLPLGNDLAYDIAWNAGATRLAAAGADKAVRIATGSASDGTWSVSATLRPHSAAVLATLWLPADDLVLSAGVDQSLRLLSPAGGETIRSLDNHRGAVRDLASQPGQRDGPAVVASAGADRTVRLWWPTANRLVRWATLPVAPTAVCWTTSGSHVLAACEDGRLRAIDPQTVAISELPGQIEGWAYAVVVTPDGKSAVLAGQRGQLRLIDLSAINR